MPDPFPAHITHSHRTIPTPTPETIAIITTSVAKGYALPVDTAEHIVKKVVRMLGEVQDTSSEKLTEASNARFTA